MATTTTDVSRRPRRPKGSRRPRATNTSTHYGAVAKAFHWTIAAAILAMIPTGFVANAWPSDTAQQVAVKVALFSTHKTLGLAVFLLALARIGWALSQPKPAPAAADHPALMTLASVAHWLLYASLVVVPLTGWIQHAASTGFAPIWWPFGQSLPFVPKDPGIASTFATLHNATQWVLTGTLVLHVAGALKHHFIAKDATLRRMLPGRPPIVRPVEEPPGVKVAPAAAVAVLGLAIISGLFVVAPSQRSATAAVSADAPAPTGWTVESGELGITIRQMGSRVTGTFADWSAAIEFRDEAIDGRHGNIEVTIAIPSLTLGSVTETAMEAQYFNAAEHPTAKVSADILSRTGNGTYRADGTLRLKGIEVPLRFDFTLTREEDLATAVFSTSLDRTAFGIGMQQSADTLGHEVIVEGRVTARRQIDDAVDQTGS